MSHCELEKNSEVAGITLFSKGKTCKRQTAVFIPPKHQLDNPQLNVILWLHGYYLPKIEQIFGPDNNGGDCKIRESVLDSDKDVVLIAPFLGFVKALKGDEAGENIYYGSAKALGKGKACQDHLLEVLAAIAQFLNSSSTGQKSSDPLKLEIEHLYIACHSGGGAAMLNIIQAESLGSFKPSLEGCWGFDCIRMAEYPSVASKNSGVDFYFYFEPNYGDGAYALWEKVYGIPGGKEPDAVMQKYHLAPATISPGVEDDQRAFQSVEDIKKKPQSSPTYEKFRQGLDALLPQKGKWLRFLSEHKTDLKGHYQVPAHLLGPRIRQSVP